MSTSPISGPGSFASPGPSSPNTTSAPLATPPRGAQAATPDKPGPGASASQVQSQSQGQSQNRSQGAATAHTLQHHHAAATRQPDQISATQFATSMVTTYDGGAHSRNEAADRNNTLPVLQTARLSMTGLPPGQVKKNLDEMQFAGALAQMSEARRVQFAQRANALRTAPQDQYAAMQRSLRNDVNRELGRVRADPVSRMQAVFNAPVGIALLGENGQQQMAALRNAQTQMNAPGATPAQREQAFAGGSGIKTRLQSQILQKSQDIYAAQQKKWADSMARVNQMLDDAQKYQADTIQLPGNSDDPEWDENTRKPAYAKTFPYQSVMEKLLSPDGYSQQERGHSTGRTLPPEDRARDLLTFQQGMSDPGSDIHRRVMKLEQQALSTMAAPGPDLDAGSPATTLSDVAAHPPQYDQNYVQNLAAGYRGVLRDTELQNRVMLRKPIPGLADQVLYGIGRFAADLSPIPGLDWFANQLLDVQFPDHGGLSDQQVKNVDMGAMFTGLLLGRGEPEGEALLKPPVVGHGEAPGGGPGEVHGTGSGTESRTDGGTGPTQEPPPGMTAPQAGPAANGPQGQPPQGGAGSAFTPGGMPKGYALNRAPASYGPSATPGVYADAANGQKFIIADGQAFAVRYDKENATYRIYDPANPSRPTYPVRRDPETGRWEIHNNVGLQGGVGRLPAETRQKAEALLRDGWTIVNTADRLGIGEFSVRAIRKSLNLAVFPSPPLASNSLRQTVMARLNAGASRVEIARDMHIQPETVDLIGGYWRGPMAHRALPIREDQRAAGAQQPAASSGLRGPASPQPGTSTGGHTHPSARHPYVDEPQPRPIDPVAARGLRRADATKLSEKTGQKAKALIRDGWANSAVGRELRMSVNTVAKIKQTMDPADFLSPALKSLTLPGEVIARLDAGIPGAQIAQEMHLQPETVDRIDREYRADRLAADLYRARMARAPAGADQAAESSGLRRPASPQPGASTGGHTHPPAKRQRVDEPQIAGEDPMTSEVLRQLTNQIPAERIAQNMQLRPDVVNAIIDRYVKSEARKLHQEFLAEQASQPAAAAGAQPVSPAHRQEVIRQLGEGHTSAEIAARMNLTVYQVEEITNQHLREEIARFHPDPAQ